VPLYDAWRANFGPRATGWEPCSIVYIQIHWRKLVKNIGGKRW